MMEFSVVFRHTPFRNPLFRFIHFDNFTQRKF